MVKRPFALAAVALVLSLGSSQMLGAAEKTTEKAKNDNVVKDGMLVSFDYTLKGTDGKQIDSSKGREPFKYVHGQHMIPPGLEKELTGMKVGGEKHVTVKPEDAYGTVNKNAFQEVPKEKLPVNGLKVGAMLGFKTPDGHVTSMRVAEIKEKTVVMDLNHPMAGKTLVFDVKVVDIQPAPPPPSASPSPQTAPPTKSANPAAPGKPSEPAQPAKPAEPAKK